MVIARDRGDPPLETAVDIDLTVVHRNNKPPEWNQTLYGPIYVPENVHVGSVVASISAS